MANAATLREPRRTRGLSRQRILAESARIFNRRGYHGTTLDEIARALGVTKPALYHHVRSKEELLFECHRALIDIALDGLRLARARAERPDEQLRVALAHYIQGITDQLHGGVVLLEEGALSAPLREQVIRGRDEYERQLREIIARGVAEGVFVRCDPKLVAFAVLGAGNWIPRWYRPDGERSSPDIAAAFSEYLVRGLVGRPPEGAPRPPLGTTSRT